MNLTGLRKMKHNALMVVICALPVVLVTGCAAPQRIEPQGAPVEEALPNEIDLASEQIAADPAAYLREVADRCREMTQYRLLFTRHERRGLFQTMFGPEHINCWFRQEPFSVRMKWLDEDIKYGESVYVEGQHKNKVRFVTRWWSPPLLPPPSINSVAVTTPVLFGEARRPITDFGLQQMMDRTLASMEEAGDGVTLSYNGPIQLEDDGRIVHHFHAEYLPSLHKTPIQELYIDVTNGLPAGTVLKRANGTIDAAYFYAEIDADVRLRDADFLLEVEREETADDASGGGGA